MNRARRDFLLMPLLPGVLAFLLLSTTLEAGARAGEDRMSGLAEGNSQFALELYGRLRNEPGNLFFSPESISTALAMTYAGARGETAAQMASVLHFPPPQNALPGAYATLLKELQPPAEKPGYRLDLANRLWGQQGYHFLPEFLAVTRDDYQAELGEVDFIGHTEEAREAINAWIEKQTEEKIKDLVTRGALTPQSRLVLTNAIYFKGAWTKPFVKVGTHDQPFHLSGGKTVSVPLMHKTDEYAYAASDGLKLLGMPYGTGNVSMVVLLPDQLDGLPALEEKLTLTNLSRWMGQLRNQRVQVYFPRFRQTSQFSLSTELAAMGMPLAFDEKRADFTGMSSQDPLFISAVLHKAFVDVNEEGTEAAAATAVLMAARAALVRSEPPLFRADHPFLFLIVDNRSKSILFLGRMVNPAA